MESGKPEIEESEEANRMSMSEDEMSELGPIGWTGAIKNLCRLVKAGIMTENEARARLSLGPKPDDEQEEASRKRRTL